MRKYTQKELRQLVRLGVAEDYTNKPSEYIYTLRRLEKVGYSSGVYGINGGLVQDTETGALYPTQIAFERVFMLYNVNTHYAAVKLLTRRCSSL